MWLVSGIRQVSWVEARRIYGNRSSSISHLLPLIPTPQCVCTYWDKLHIFRNTFGQLDISLSPRFSNRHLTHTAYARIWTQEGCTKLPHAHIAPSRWSSRCSQRRWHVCPLTFGGTLRPLALVGERCIDPLTHRKHSNFEARLLYLQILRTFGGTLKVGTGAIGSIPP